MKTVEELQKIVDEIKEVCKKHEVILIGTCDSEGIYGEIAIMGITEEEFSRQEPESQLTNEVEPYYKGFGFYVNGIGALRSKGDNL